jgi:hypothetical protein
VRKFQIIRETTTHCRLVEIYTTIGVYREFTGATCVSDALRHMNRCCSTCRTFEIVNGPTYTK